MSSSMQRPEPQPIDLNGRLAATINEAGARGVPVAVSYVDASGRPHVSPRGTVHVVGTDELALWARSPGLPDALATNPNVALLYQDLAERTFYQFSGRGRRVDDPAVRDRVFESSPPHERAQDPRRAGTAILIALDTVQGRGPDGIVVMARDAEPA